MQYQTMHNTPESAHHVACPATGTTYPYYNPYVHVTPAPQKSNNPIAGTVIFFGKKLEGVTRKTESMIGNIYSHLKASPGVTDILVARTKVLADGGYHKAFQQSFGYCLPGESLIDAYACYLSTATGPVMGTVYLSNKRLAFCSDRPVYYGGVSGGGVDGGHSGGANAYAAVPPKNMVENWVYYKVVVPVEQLKTVFPSSNPKNHCDRYIVVQTKDGQEFWFLGFLSYDKALKNLYKVLQYGTGHNSHGHGNHGGTGTHGGYYM